MIDFRYHIVSITAVFLALGIGVAVGATVLDQVSVEALRNQLDGLSSDLDARRAEITDLRALARRMEALVSDLGPRVTAGRLVGRSVLFVDASQDAGWVDTARDAVGDAGAEVGGTLSLTPRWDSTGAAEALPEAWSAAELVAPEDATVEDYGRLLGEVLLGPQSSRLVAELERVGYARTSVAGEGSWPPSVTDVVMFTSGADADPQARWMASLATGAAGHTTTLILGAATEDPGAVALLRRQRNLPLRLATFDSGELDTAGVGSVLALSAAIDGRGGHYGTASGLSYLPPA